MSMRCQSCGMLIMKREEFGTTSTGVMALDYCHYCYDRGEFIEPDLTFDQMVEKLAAPVKAGKNLSDEQAKEMVRTILLDLKRWKHLQGPGQTKPSTDTGEE